MTRVAALRGELARNKTQNWRAGNRRFLVLVGSSFIQKFVAWGTCPQQISKLAREIDGSAFWLAPSFIGEAAKNVFDITCVLNK
jgi:hypothetical protein